MNAPLPLALLPGLLCDQDLWRDQIAALEGERPCRVADFSGQDSVAAMAGVVLEVMPERFALAGLSMGGYVGFEVLRQAPERVDRLALLNTKARPDTEEQTRRRKGLIQLARKGTFRGVTERLLPMLIHEARLTDDVLTGRVMAMAETIGRDGFLGQQAAIMGRPDSLPDLVKVTCPTLVLCGREDQLTPVDCHREMAAGIAKSRLVVLDECGHLSPMERPDAVTEALQAWLREE